MNRHEHLPDHGRVYLTIAMQTVLFERVKQRPVSLDAGCEAQAAGDMTERILRLAADFREITEQVE